MNTKSIASIALLATVASAANLESISFSVVCGNPGTEVSNYTVPVTANCTQVCTDSVIVNGTDVQWFQDTIVCEGISAVNTTVSCNGTIATIADELVAQKAENATCNFEAESNSTSTSHSASHSSEGSSASTVFASIALVAVSVVAALL
ncbi:expressed protein [Dictyostelium purpureum]|uniref:Expressed protein n=1 Tax=Dictyostelium purpureum TaxID=5786 RepID=F0ZDE2_DICPU|nr:uncharacterized protein DICPUDRAFT_91500 [Dictyostelium purpureum]EGC38051.1 expressed protein [Dictyostelium purpureum]|eukprot:XP_003285452.1 expressed protein [Dictyostelium purpureum]